MNPWFSTQTEIRLCGPNTPDEADEVQRSGGVVDLLPQSALTQYRGTSVLVGCCPCSTHEASRRVGNHCPVWKGV